MLRLGSVLSRTFSNPGTLSRIIAHSYSKRSNLSAAVTRSA